MIDAEIVSVIAAIHKMQFSNFVVVVPGHPRWTASEVRRILRPIEQHRITRKNIFPESRVRVHPFDQRLVRYAELNAVACKQLVVWEINVVE